MLCSHLRCEQGRETSSDCHMQRAFASIEWDVDEPAMSVGTLVCFFVGVALCYYVVHTRQPFVGMLEC